MLRFLKTSSFRFRLILGIVLVIVVVEAIHIMALWQREVGKFETELARQSETVADAAGVLLSRPIWDFNYDVVRSMVSGLASQPGILQVVLTDAEGGVIAQAGVEGSDVLSLNKEIYFGEDGLQQWIGEVRIAFDRSGVRARLQDGLRQEIMVSLLLMVAILVPVVILVDRFLEPVSRLVAATGRLRRGNIDAPVPDLDRPDELGALAAALEHLRRTEAKLRKFRRIVEIRNQSERRRMLRALSAASDAVIVFDEEDKVTFRNPMAEQLFASVEVTELIPSVAMNESVEQQVSLPLPGANQPRAIRLRTDPILDENGAFLGRVLLATDETAQVWAREQAEFNACHDMLTGLANRRFLGEQLHDARVRQEEVALLLVDLDKFKPINDRFGHVVGDEVLHHVAGLMTTIAQKADTPLRMGGDEFAVLAMGPGAGDRVRAYGEDLTDRLRKPLKVGPRRFRLGISGGTAVTHGAGIRSLSRLEDLVQHADIALYEAKRRGGGCIVPFHKDFDDAVRRRVQIENALRQALAEGRNGLTPVFQPQTDLRSREVTGFEALARLVCRGGSLIPPAEFIPLAEDTGLIAPLTARILTETMQLAMQIRKTGFPGRVAVNISPRLFEMDLASLLEEARAATGCDPDLIELEITEQLVLSEDVQAEDQIDRLREAGFRVVLDDFGVGYSSFNYLQRFNFDKIKIDRTFAVQAKQTPKALRIIAAITEMGHALGAQVVAEGVETDADIAALEKTGIDIIQGWVDGQPLKASELAPVLEQPCWWFDAELLKSA